MLRLGSIIGIVLGALGGFLASLCDIDTSLGSFKTPFYVAIGVTFGWMGGMVPYMRDSQAGSQAPNQRNEDLAAAVRRAEAAEAEVQRLKTRLNELEGRKP